MKLHQTLLAFTAGTLLTGGALRSHAGEEKTESVTLADVPAAVKTTLKGYAADTEVKKTELGDQDGSKVYEFDIEKGARKFEVSVTPGGKFMGTEEEIQLADMPAPAQATLKTQAGSNKLSGFEKAEDENHQVTYEGVIEKNGKKTEVAVDAAGKVVNTEAVGAEKD
jgi:hypothetical protein